MAKEYFDSEENYLDNGLRIITIKKNTNLASLHAGINIGSLYEKKSELGISHFIEHMLFKGTENMSNEEINDALEQLGGDYNAFTDYSCTAYSSSTLAEEIEGSIKLIADMLINSIFPEEEIEKERGVVLSEIKAGKDDIEESSFRRVNNIAFLKSPVRYGVIGEEKTVNGFTKLNLFKFYKKYYVPNNCIISIVSPYEHEFILNLISAYFHEWKRKQFIKKDVIIEDNIPLKKILWKKDLEQSAIIYLYTFHNLTKKQELILKVLNHKLGESGNSILFRELREKRGLAYDVYSDMEMTRYVKTLYIYTAVDDDKVNEALQVIDSCIEGIKKREINFDDKTIDLMRKVLKTSVAATLEDTSDLGDYVLSQVLDGESIYEFIEDMKELDNITRNDLYEIANLIFNNPTIHILTSHK